MSLSPSVATAKTFLNQCLKQPAHLGAGRGPMRETRTLRMARRLREERFDLALLLTNSFRSAVVAWRAGVRRRIAQRWGPFLTRYGYAV